MQRGYRSDQPAGLTEVIYEMRLRRKVLFVAILPLVLLFVGSKRSFAAVSSNQNQPQMESVCVGLSGASTNVSGTNLNRKLAQAIPNDNVKVQALSRAFFIACRPDLIDLSPTFGYQRLKELLSVAREEFETTGAITNATLKSLEQDVGVTKEDIRNPRGQILGWKLVIDKKAKDNLRIRTAASLASNGYLLVEAFHQLTGLADFESERKVLLDGIERTAKAILDYPDENGDGRYGWGRVWFKGKDGLLLHTTLPAQNLYFGGYTYFPRTNSLGQATCEQSAALKEEAFDHAHNSLFLLESFLVTRDKALAKMILLTVGKAFDDTFAEGGVPKELGSQGWYYWKSLGKSHQTNQEECEVGREIKNTNLRMGLALLAFSEILRHNSKDLEGATGLAFNPDKYLDRAMQVIRTNNYEIFANNNFGYQGVNSRNVELRQEAGTGALVYDRTQIPVSLDDESIRDLKDVIVAGDKAFNKSGASTVTICGGSAGAPVRDRGIAGSCWNHLPFEAEDYFRFARFSGAWGGSNSSRLIELLDALTRNIAASKLLHDGREGVYAHYFPHRSEKIVSNEVVNAAFYGFFCMAKNLPKQSGVSTLPIIHQRVLSSLADICNSMPQESEDTGVTWRKGYKFYELYLAADRLKIQTDDLLLRIKN